jgi:hypothetical protein
MLLSRNDFDFGAFGFLAPGLFDMGRALPGALSAAKTAGVILRRNAIKHILTMISRAFNVMSHVPIKINNIFPDNVSKQNLSSKKGKHPQASLEGATRCFICPPTRDAPTVLFVIHCE